VNLSSFSQAGDNIEKEFNDSIVKVALDIDRRIVNRTPVDTGRAKGNWIASIGTPDTRQLKAGEQDSIKQAQSTLSNFKGFKKIIIQNNLPYIQRLNNPPQWSLQAPPGYIQAEIQSVVERNR
jgi:hypothetical protein